MIQVTKKTIGMLLIVAASGPQMTGSKSLEEILLTRFNFDNEEVPSVSYKIMDEPTIQEEESEEAEFDV